jgi:hypothetical protein
VKGRGAVWVVAVLAVCACAKESGGSDADADASTNANASTNADASANADANAPHPSPLPAGGERENDGTSTSTPTSTPSPSPLPISAAVAKAGAAEQPIVRDGVTTIDPASAFRVEVAAHLVDGRLSIHDEQDAMVASSGTTEVGETWTRFEITPDEPLRPGSSFALRVDGAAEREAHDRSGKPYAPAVMKLKTTGERPPPQKAQKPARAKKRRR